MNECQQIIENFKFHLSKERDMTTSLETTITFDSAKQKCFYTLVERTKEGESELLSFELDNSPLIEPKLLEPIALLCAESSTLLTKNMSISAENDGTIDDKLVFANNNILIVRNLDYEIAERLSRLIKDTKVKVKTMAEVPNQMGFSTGQSIAIALVVLAGLLFAMAYFFR